VAPDSDQPRPHALRQMCMRRVSKECAIVAAFFAILGRSLTRIRNLHSSPKTRTIAFSSLVFQSNAIKLMLYFICVVTIMDSFLCRIAGNTGLSAEPLQGTTFPTGHSNQKRLQLSSWLHTRPVLQTRLL